MKPQQYEMFTVAGELCDRLLQTIRQYRLIADVVIRRQYQNCRIWIAIYDIEQGQKNAVRCTSVTWLHDDVPNGDGV
jgi:hypothetical protein